MNNQNTPLRSLLSFFYTKEILLLIQFFFIIVVYHTMKDMKDTVVITATQAGAEVIPFIKIWGMLPASIIASYLFSKLYEKYGRDKTTYIIVIALVAAYSTFAFLLYPLREQLYLGSVYDTLTPLLPAGARGFIAMVSYWHYTLFYVTAELWSPLVLSVLFWGYINETTTFEEAKRFYPICMVVGNCAGVVSGQASCWLCHDLREMFSWQETLQILILVVGLCCALILGLNRLLSRLSFTSVVVKEAKDKRKKGSFTENLLSVVRSPSLLAIAILVVGFGLTTNLIEVVWKENIKALYPDPQAYNAYVNRLTSIIGAMAVVMALASRFFFQWLSWSKVVLMTPVLLFVVSSLFFYALLMPAESLTTLVSLFGVTPLVFVVTMGSIYYVAAMSAKYTIFDSSKEMAFLSVDQEDRIRAKSVIDSIGARLGKSGASCLYQFLLIFFGTASAHLSIIGMTSMGVIFISIIAAKKLGERMNSRLAQTTAQDKVQEAVA